MAKSRPIVISKDLGDKITNAISKLLDEKTERLKIKNAKNGQEEASTFPVLARDLKASEILLYAQGSDFSLKRTQKFILEKAIEKVWKEIKLEESEELKGLGLDEEIDKETFLAEKNLMEVVDTNSMNRSIVDLWGSGPKEDEKDEKDKSEEKSEENDANTETSDKKEKKRKGKDSEKPNKRIKSKDRTPPSLTLSQLGGLDDIITELMEVVGMPILHPEIYLATGIHPPRGVLLHGPPGCGKTTIANALAGELQVPFISLSAPSVVSGMSGESEKKIRGIFEEAKELAPCLIFFDEIDAITPKRDGGAQREMERRIVAQLLTSMDELSLDKTDGKPVIIIGATNRPDSLDPALRRAGRFDREICINVPNELARYNIMESMMKTIKASGDLQLMKLAKMTPGYVGADLKALVSAAGISAIKRIFSTLSQEQEKKIIEAMYEEEKQDADTMDIDEGITDKTRELTHLSTIQKFLLKHPHPLTEEQLAPLSITYEDFITALPTIQPTAKREGFATVPDVTWKSVGALSKTRVELHMAIVQPIKRPEIYEKVGITAPAGVLMWGPPGCGKTLLAKAVANESKANFISIKGPELLNKYVGESEKAIRQVFSRARASIPCVIFFDELDALVPRRDASLSESSSRVVNTLLTELDGLNDRKGIFVIGATNRPDMIDPAMLRPGRLDKTLYIELPTADERLEIMKTVIRVNGTPISSDVNLEAIAHDERCRNFSGADLSSLVREAGVISLKRRFFTEINQGVEDICISDSEQIMVTPSDFETALDSVNPSVSDRDRQKYERLNRRLGWSKTTGGPHGDNKDAEEDN
ncbi:hypothetical protein LJB42_003125 [Komagataella kurtzmanii]|nr:hypothetical protein LJB42_003125 [Komagataella kurtzmanii]